VSDPAKDLITKLLVKNPENRITLDDAMNHAWFKVELPAEPVVDPEVLRGS
jgi:serine/threonine protein kinase